MGRAAGFTTDGEFVARTATYRILLDFNPLQLRKRLGLLDNATVVTKLNCTDHAGFANANIHDYTRHRFY